MHLRPAGTNEPMSQSNALQMSSSSPSSPASSRRATLTRATTGVRSSSFSTNDSSNLDESVTVCVRCRPSPSKKIIAVYPDESQICVTNPKGGNGGVGSAGGNNGGPDKLFTFDAALDEAASQVGCERERAPCFSETLEEKERLMRLVARTGGRVQFGCEQDR